MYLASDPMLQCQPRPLVMERRWKSNVELAPNCPRCASSNTKFCYYNNYSLSQPRYFCKGCRRYWTKGGTLRNVPVGGGCRKSRRTKAVRAPSGDRLSVFTNDGGGSPSPALTTSEPSNSLVPPGGPNGQDIDLAAVFAKFLNQGTLESHDEANQLSKKSGSSNQDVLLEDIFIECQTQSNSTEEGENFLSGLTEVFSCGDHQTQQIEHPAQGFPGHDSNTFGLQSMLSDDLPQDLLWSDATNSFPNFAWQPITQLHEFGSNPCDDPLKISANVGDNWSLFDMPAYEIFSRP